MAFGTYEPVLDPPPDLENREAPTSDHRKLGIEEARVMATFDVAKAQHKYSAMPAKDESPVASCGTTLNEAFANIRSRPGVSCLSAIIWRDMISNETLVQLNLNISSWKARTAILSASQCYQFGMLRDEWDALVAPSLRVLGRNAAGADDSEH